MIENYPYSNLYNLNLDWLVKVVKEAEEKMNNIDDAVKEAIEKVVSSLVYSVNGENGDVVLYQEQSVQLPALTELETNNWQIWRTIDGTAVGIQFDATNQKVEFIYGSNRYELYSSNNPQPASGVTAFNTRTGAVTLNEDDVNGLDINSVEVAEGTGTITEKYTQLQLQTLYSQGIRVVLCTSDDAHENDLCYFLYRYASGNIGVFLVETAASASASVTSVNGLTGTVVLNGSNLNTSSTSTKTINSFVNGFNGGTAGQILTKNSATDQDYGWDDPAVTSVNGSTGEVTLDYTSVGASPVGGSATTLWTGSVYAGNSITLSEACTDFKFLIFQTNGPCQCWRPSWRGSQPAFGIRAGGSSNENMMEVLLVMTLDDAGTTCTISDISYHWCNTTTVSHNTNDLAVQAVYGIK